MTLNIKGNTLMSPIIMIKITLHFLGFLWIYSKIGGA